ncbi:FAD-linked oxidase [Tardibacter chloracetimidivorans]|uniref:FAD-linked oxidase n=1 Tax=Tardibacter chloracetimidivorans TaxID=1921510 RepID=A0A1L3ZX74_9SPHN|nr:FAD-binding protein [Tardibacter chloracetimidivorans]API60233.1 FAD-linked oxidase [Tardibacter chloracetimidivorans]
MASAIALRPTCVEDLVEIVLEARRDRRTLAPAGGRSKADIGAHREDAVPIDMTGFAGVIDYDPAELVLTVGTGTPLAEIDALVAAERQMLAFDPFDHGPIFGRPEGHATIGGIVAAGVAGSQRLSCGSARDHLLGFQAVSGRGEALRAGARVVKNVTGYDLPKLAAGSWGRLFAMAEVTLKVLPRPLCRSTRVIAGLNPDRAVRAMAAALGSQAEVAAAAHIPAHLRGGTALTGLRIQGFGPSVQARGALLDRLLADHGRVEALDDAESDSFWESMRTVEPLGGDDPLWRVNVPPSKGSAVVAALRPSGARWMFDWAGGLVWVAFDGDPALVRTAAADAGGHALLVRGPASLRAAVPTFHPPAPGVAALEARVRRAFDPDGIFETGRFGGYRP